VSQLRPTAPPRKTGKNDQNRKKTVNVTVALHLQLDFGGQYPEMPASAPATLGGQPSITSPPPTPELFPREWEGRGDESENK